MTKRHDHHEKHIVLNGVDDPVITNTYPIAGPTPQGTGRRGPWVVGQETDCSLDAGTDRRIQLSQCP